MRQTTAFALLLCSLALTAQPVPHATGIAHTAQVDLAYETFGSLGNRDLALPIIAVNGGPGLSHAYMVQNDLWERVGKERLVVLYDQRGTGASKRLAEGVSQSGASQAALRKPNFRKPNFCKPNFCKPWTRRWLTWTPCGRRWASTKFALLGDSYGGLS